MVLDDLQSALDEVNRIGPSAFADAESIPVLQRLLIQLDALVTSSVAAFDAAQNWEVDGACSARAWLKSECGLSSRQAATQVKRGRHLRHLPETSDAFARGALSGDYVDTIISADRGNTAEALLAAEKQVVDQGCRLRHGEFVQYMNYWKQAVDQDGTDEDAEARRNRRDAYLVQSYGGMWFGQMTLDPTSGTIVGEELDRLERLLFDVEWAEARDRLGREPSVADLPRSPSQRRADALVEMASRSKSAPHDGRRPAPLFTVLVNYETLHGRICQLENGTVIPPSSLDAWLPEADLERAEFKAGGRVDIGAPSKLSAISGSALERAVFTPRVRAEVPPASRLFTGAIRRSIEVRDQICTHPTCDVRASRCQVDHIQPYSLGGLTTQENGRLLCGRHNRMRNQVTMPKRE